MFWIIGITITILLLVAIMVSLDQCDYEGNAPFVFTLIVFLAIYFGAYGALSEATKKPINPPTIVKSVDIYGGKQFMMSDGVSHTDRSLLMEDFKLNNCTIEKIEITNHYGITLEHEYVITEIDSTRVIKRSFSFTKDTP